MKNWNFLYGLRVRDCLNVLFIPFSLVILWSVVLNKRIYMDIFSKAIFIVFIAIVFAFMINNYFDYYLDKKNPKKTLKFFTRNNSLDAALITFLSGFLLTVLWLPGLVIIYILTTFVSFLYSFKLQHTPLMDLISHALSLVMFFIFLALAVGIETETLFMLSIVTILVSNMIELENEITDYRYDKEYGENNTAIYVGFDRAVSFYHVSTVLLILSLFYLALELAKIEIPFLALIPVVLWLKSVLKWKKESLHEAL